MRRQTQDTCWAVTGVGFGWRPSTPAKRPHYASGYSYCLMTMWHHRNTTQNRITTNVILYSLTSWFFYFFANSGSLPTNDGHYRTAPGLPIHTIFFLKCHTTPSHISYFHTVPFLYHTKQILPFISLHFCTIFWASCLHLSSGYPFIIQWYPSLPILQQHNSITQFIQLIIPTISITFC